MNPGAGWCSASCTRRWAVPRRPSGRCGRAPPKPAGWHRPRSGRTSPTAGPPPRSDSSPVRRPTAPPSPSTGRCPASALEGGARPARAQPRRLDRRPSGAGGAGHGEHEGGCTPRSGCTPATAGRWPRRRTTSWATTRRRSGCCRTSSPPPSAPAGSTPAGACWAGFACSAASAYERLGRRAEAREEYRQVLAQWSGADPTLLPFVKQAEQGLARLGEG